MKKQVKMISIVLVIMMALLSISNVVLATDKTEEVGTDIGSMIADIGVGDNTNTETIAGFGKTLVTILQTVGIVVAIVVLLVLGIKYMMGSAEEKAEYKKTMIPYLVGAALIFGASTIVNIVYSVISSGMTQA